MNNGDLRFDSDPDVLTAVARATEVGSSLDCVSGTTTPRLSMLIELTRMWFFEEMYQRLGPED